MKTMSFLRRPRRSSLTFALVSALLLLACGEGMTAVTEAKQGAKVSAFELKSLDGRKLGPQSFAGKVVVIDFWATWCAPCHVQARILEPLHKEYKTRGVQFLAANVGEEEAAVRKFLEKKPLPYPVLMDPGDVSAGLGVMALPAVIVIDKKGKVTFFQQGLADEATLRRALKQAGA